MKTTKSIDTENEIPFEEEISTKEIIVQSYQLSLDKALEEYRPELEFACDFLDQCHYVSRQNKAELLLHYGNNPPEGAIHVPTVLFPKGVHLNSDGIHPDFNVLRKIATEQALLQ